MYADNMSFFVQLFFIHWLTAHVGSDPCVPRSKVLSLVVQHQNDPVTVLHFHVSWHRMFHPISWELWTSSSEVHRSRSERRSEPPQSHQSKVPSVSCRRDFASNLPRTNKRLCAMSIVTRALKMRYPLRSSDFEAEFHASEMTSLEQTSNSHYGQLNLKNKTILDANMSSPVSFPATRGSTLTTTWAGPCASLPPWSPQRPSTSLWTCRPSPAREQTTS